MVRVGLPAGGGGTASQGAGMDGWSHTDSSLTLLQTSWAPQGLYAVMGNSLLDHKGSDLRSINTCSDPERWQAETFESSREGRGAQWFWELHSTCLDLSPHPHPLIILSPLPLTRVTLSTGRPTSEPGPEQVGVGHYCQEPEFSGAQDLV